MAFLASQIYHGMMRAIEGQTEEGSLAGVGVSQMSWKFAECGKI
jgi:hypothetical protein